MSKDVVAFCMQISIKKDQVKRVKNIYTSAHGRVQKEIWLPAIGLAFGHKETQYHSARSWHWKKD